MLLMQSAPAPAFFPDVCIRGGSAAARAVGPRRLVLTTRQTAPNSRVPCRRTVPNCPEAAKEAELHRNRLLRQATECSLQCLPPPAQGDMEPDGIRSD